MTETVLTGSAAGIFIVYLGRTLYELAKQRNGTRTQQNYGHLSSLSSPSKPACAVELQKILERQTAILEKLSDTVGKTNERIAVLVDRRQGGQP